MPKTKDDLEAVRLVAEALNGFSKEDQKRIIRWAREKVGLHGASLLTKSIDNPTLAEGSKPHSPGTTDIRRFIEEKRPGTDMHFAAAVAYYYNYEEAIPGFVV